MEILKAPASQFGLPLKHVFLCGCQHAVKPTQHGQGQDDVLVLASLEGVPG